jgi:aminoglycoside 6'-N-acetyltransferase
MADVPPLSEGSLRLRPQPDLASIAAVLSDPTVARWWGVYDAERVAAEYGDADPGTVVYAIEHDGTVAGIIQFAEELDADYRAASIDIALTAPYQGRGLGVRAIQLLASYLFEARGHHRITIDPALTNTNAIRAYEKVGFRRVGVMREYERGSDGTWHDNLLMDLLASEFRRP